MQGISLAAPSSIFVGKKATRTRSRRRSTPGAAMGVRSQLTRTTSRRHQLRRRRPPIRLLTPEPPRLRNQAKPISRRTARMYSNRVTPAVVTESCFGPGSALSKSTTGSLGWLADARCASNPGAGRRLLKVDARDIIRWTPTDTSLPGERIMAQLVLPYCAMAFLVGSCSHGGHASGSSTAGGMDATTDSGLASGIVLLTPAQWAQISDTACAGAILISPSMNDASTPLDAGGCVFTLPVPLPGQVIDPNYINIIYSSALNPSQRYLVAPGNYACALGDGWYMNGNTEIELCAKTCAMVQQDPSTTLEILAGCVVFPIGPT